MSSSNSGGTTATTDIAQFLSNNSGWHEVAEIANATGYSHGHVLSTATKMANDSSSPVKRRKNRRKPIIGYIFNGQMEVPGSDRQKYIRLIKLYGTNAPANLHSMTLDRLQKELRRVADGMSRLDSKVEFRIP